ncbi:MAG: response regulator [Thiotrichaceae bacterium]|nr:response regulator [Thiotrichaceae bacterium]
MSHEDKHYQLLERRLNREKNARKQAEGLLEKKSRELYASNQQLQNLANNLEHQITDRTTELRVAHDQALCSSRSKSIFLANMSHEIRTPMNGVIGMTTLLMDSGLTPDQKRQASVIRSSAESLLRIINDILDLSKLESGKFDLQSRDFILCELLDSILSSLAITAAQKKLEILCLVERGVYIALTGDAIRLRQIIVNLLGNAIKFTSEGYILLKVSQQSHKDKTVRLCFDIIDTGMGIPKKAQLKLFQPFNQVTDYDDKRPENQGTGLGLSISKNLSKLMKGNIGVESEEGKGSRFWLELPFTLHSDLSVEGQSIGAIALYQPRVDIRSIMKAQLEALSNDVTVVNELSTLCSLSTTQTTSTTYIVDIEYLSKKKCHELLKHINTIDSRTLKHWIFIFSINSNNGKISQHLNQLNASILIKPISQIKIQRLITQPSTNQAEFDHTPPTNSQRGKVLLVEDNRVNQMVGIGLLGKHHLDVVIANNGAEAIKIYQQEEGFDLIFMDINMPIMSGIEATQKLQVIMKEQKHSVPIIALTANVMVGAAENYIEDGMDDYLSKPIELDQLKMILDQWLFQHH